MSASAKQHWEPTVKEYFEDHIPIEIIEEYKQIKDKAKSNGKAVTEKVTKKYIENFILTYNKNSKERLKKKDYFFFKGLEEKIRKDARLYSLKTSIEEYDYITSIKIDYYNLYTEYVKELTSNLQAVFNPYFTETEKSRLIHNSDFLDRTLLGTMYGNHELIEEIINDIKYPEIELTIEGKPIKFETEFDKNGKINRPVGNYSLSEVETKAYLKYNFDIDLKNWSEGKSKSSIINYIENYISDLKNKNLAINDTKYPLPIEEKLNTIFKNNLIIEAATAALGEKKNGQNSLKEHPKKESSSSKTRDLINSSFEIIQKDCFRTDDDYQLFLQLLTDFFEGKPYKLPDNKINLKKRTKTKISPHFNDIHKELIMSNIVLKNDKEYFKLIRILNHFSDLDDAELYHTITR